MGSIRNIPQKDGTTKYHAEIRRKGVPPQRRSFDTRTEAKDWIQDIESALRDGRYFRGAASKKRTVGELIDRFIQEWLPKNPHSQKKQTALLNWWKSQLGHCLLADLSSSILASSRDKLLSGITVSV